MNKLSSKSHTERAHRRMRELNANDMNTKEKIHEKAIRLVEGGIVEVDGICVILHREPYIFDPCYVCDMDYLCHKGSEICSVCEECDRLTRNDCILVPYT